jgi:hypothetical protein
VGGAVSSSSLSPFATPFDPVGSIAGRAKSQRWVDDDGEETDDDHPATYLEAAHCPTKPPTTSPVRSGAEDPCEGGGSTAGRAPSWCMACLLILWTVRSLPTNALVPADRSLPPTPMGGGRSNPDRRRHLRLPQLSHAATQVCTHRLGRSTCTAPR